MEIDNEIRSGVIHSLPEAKEIQNVELREKVYDAWAISLQKNGYIKIEEMEPSSTPGGFITEIGSQADHLRGVARLALAIAKELSSSFKDFQVDMDEVIAGALCHDIGKPFEYSKANQEKWNSDPRVTGNPSIRHTVYGVYISLFAGLPEKIAHIAGAHSKEGEFVKRSLAAEIVHYADEAYWRILECSGIVEDLRKR